MEQVKKNLKLYKLKYKDGNGDVCRYYTRDCYVELFGWNVHFIYSDDIVKVRRSKTFVSILGTDKRNGNAYAFVEHCLGKGNMHSFVFLPWDHKTLDMCPEAIIAHECFHVVYTLAEEIGMKDEETSAYLLQMLVSHATIFSKDVKNSLVKDDAKVEV